jgi:hypothetical protein
MLLDVITVIFILASLFLVWLNLLQWPRRKVVIRATDYEAD